MINLKVTERDRYSIIEIGFNDVVTLEDLKRMEYPKLNFYKGVVITGRAPIWLYGVLIHYCHPAPWVAVYDPRLGAVIVLSHDINYKIGDIVEVNYVS